MYSPILRGLKAKAKSAGLIQSFLFSTDFEYSNLVSGIVNGGDIPFTNITYLDGSSARPPLILRMCNDIPHGQPNYPCITIFNSTVNSPKYDNESSLNSQDITSPLQANEFSTLQATRYLSDWQSGMKVTPQLDSSNATLVTGVDIELHDGTSLFLSEQCLQSLVYPSQILGNFRREDVTWISLQFWLLAISFLAIVNDSVPHVLAVLMTRTISTAWAAYAIWRGPAFRDNFYALLAEPGTPCSLDLFSDFFAKRQNFQIADSILSCTGLVFFSYLSWTLLKIYSAQSFKCVGAPEHIMRIHKFFMAVLACLQMEAFVLTAGMGLWINVLANTAINKISNTPPFIKRCISRLLLEMKRMMVIFLAIGFIITAGWAIMFYSIVFRWTFMQWPYLGCFTVASFILLISTMALGVVCRMNFDRGLAEYLHAESTLASLNFAPDAFAHKADSDRVRFSKDSKGPIRKFSFDDPLNSPPMYFVSTLQQTGNTVEVALPLSTTDSRPTKEDRTGPVPF
ncbi:hypothetical protein BDZ97DRAFT_1759777 [Flammula alnicola]|nr:hypothetical protein BDZ97DRAFT_1759777 [Flammula alnicola]